MASTMGYKVLAILALVLNLIFMSCTKVAKNQQIPASRTDSISKLDSVKNEVIFIDTVFNDSSHLAVTSVFDGIQFNDIHIIIGNKDTLIYRNIGAPDTTIEKLLRTMEPNGDFIYFMTIRSADITNGQSLIGFREYKNELKVITIDGKQILNVSGCTFEYSKQKLTTSCDIRDSMITKSYQMKVDTSFVLINK